MQRRRDSVATREAILVAAVEAFAARGYAAVTVRDVAREARVDPALVVRYFGSKSGLFTEALGAGGKSALAQVLSAPLPELPLRLAEHMAGKQGGRALTMLVLSAADPEGAPLLAQLAGQALEAPLVSALSATGVAAADAAARARAATAVLVGAALTAVALGSPPDRDRLERLFRSALDPA